MSITGRAKPWEFRWRIVIMFSSLPLAAILFIKTGFTTGTWYAPQVEYWQQITAALIASIGILLRVWGTSALSAPRMLRLQAQGEILVDTGPFALVRNPLYLGTILVIGGWSVLYGWLPALIYFVFHALRFNRIVLYEESIFESELGSRFDEYRSRVPRWIPDGSGLTKIGWPHCNFSAVLSNGPFLAMTIALWVIVFTSKTSIFFPVSVIGLLVSGAFLITRRRLQNISSATDDQ
ncbi:isoprenylcysteine carboxylmethyltransferase family protein [uncultured Gimesia sp.]|uniref:methyltransferase family protein n=1 Tax=uncultured Gimesia sp. TaxID=1678688 RepID=UPI00260B309D|nr:isoprenylcysteine carboxylmethyltransferase family protein [uncultured Gimesia sp.]